MPDSAPPKRLSVPAALPRLFWEWFKISLFVVGGGYAIIIAADDVFGRRLKWLREGELMDRLPVFQMIPGLIAGNSAIYTGLRVAGFAGAAISLVAVALPSFAIILAIARGYSSLPMDAPLLQGAFLGLRGVLTGIVLGTMLASWRRVLRGAYAWCAFAAGCVALEVFGADPGAVLLCGMGFGTVSECASHLLRRRRAAKAATAADATPGESSASSGDSDVSRGIPEVVTATDMRRLPIAAAAALAAAALKPAIFLTFAKFGLLCFGGGNVLVPLYLQTFVGPDAPMLQLPPHDFGNLLAVTQATPGPVSVNAATFFGYRLSGALGSFVATAGLLAPSFFLLVSALRSLVKWRTNPAVKGLLWGVAPATMCLMASAVVTFARMSAFAGGRLRPVAALLVAASTWAVAGRRAGIMRLVVVGGAVGLLCAALGLPG